MQCQLQCFQCLSNCGGHRQYLQGEAASRNVKDTVNILKPHKFPTCKLHFSLLVAPLPLQILPVASGIANTLQTLQFTLNLSFTDVGMVCEYCHLSTSARKVAIFTDHAILLYLYDPHGQNPSIARHTACELMRWAVKLSFLRYVIQQVAGEQNVWADVLSRWAAIPRSITKRIGMKVLVVAPVSPDSDDQLDWPTVRELKKSRKDTKYGVPKIFSYVEGVLQDIHGVIFIPYENFEL